LSNRLLLCENGIKYMHFFLLYNDTIPPQYFFIKNAVFLLRYDLETAFLSPYFLDKFLIKKVF
jgi:hypothetical protein